MNVPLENPHAPDPYAFKVIEGLAGNVRDYDLELQRTAAFESLTVPEVSGWMEQLNEPCEVLEEADYRFELKVMNPTTDSVSELFISTISSGLSNNNGPGNLFEQTVRTLARRKAAQASGRVALQSVYLSSPGNGKTSPLEPKELAEFKKSGRLLHQVDGQLQPFPWVQSLVAALKKREDIAVRHLDGDSFGALIGTAVGAAIGNNQIETVFQNGRPQLLGQPRPAFVAGMLYEGARGTKHNEQLKRDFWAATDEHKQLARDHASHVFAAPHEATGITPREMYDLTDGLSQGPYFASNRDPLLQDTMALLRENPDVRLVMASGKYDRQTGGKYPSARVRLLAEVLSSIATKNVTFVAVNGNHSWHTYNPGVRDALELALLPK